MRIALLGHAPVRGGSTDLFLQARDFFRRRGHTVQGIFGAPAQAADPRAAEEWIIEAPSGNWRERMRAYRDKVQSFHPDLVYAISGRDEADLFRFLSHVRVRHLSSLEQTEYFDVPHTLKQMRRFMEAFTANTPDALERVARISGRPGYLLPYLFPEPLRTAGTIDTDRVLDAKRPLEIAFVSRFERFQKRTHWLPRIVRDCQSAGVALNWHLYGDGPSADFLRRQLQGQPHVFFHGWIERSALYDRLPSHDIFFLCSRWEGLPIAMVEAMRCGLACVVPDIPAGMRWALQHGGGWLYAADSPAAAVRALVVAARDRRVVLQKRQEALAVARDLFSSQAAERQYLELEAALLELRFNGEILDPNTARRFRAVSVAAYARRILTSMAGRGPGS